MARLRSLCYVKDFAKAVGSVFVGISKMPMVRIEIHSCSIYLFKNVYVFQCEKFGPSKVESRVHTERFFGRKENCYLQP